MQSVGNALRVLEAFLKVGGELGTNEAARLLHLSPSVVYRLAVTLRDHRFLEQDPQTKRYRIGPMAFEIGMLYQRGKTFVSQALDSLERALPEYSRFVAVMEGDDMLILAGAEGTARIRVGNRAGERRYAHSAAGGKALLALRSEQEVLDLLARTGMPAITPATITDPQRLIEDLRKTRERGYSINDEESTQGAVSIAVPVIDHLGRPLGAVGVSILKFMATPETIDCIGRTLKGISAKLQRTSPEKEGPVM